jgi:formate/nitrite transporter
MATQTRESERREAVLLAPEKNSVRIDVATAATANGGWSAAVQAGKAKCKKKPAKLFVLGLLAGCHVGFGAMLSGTVGADLAGLKEENTGLQRLVAGAYGYPFGLFMVIVTGAELITSNFAVCSMAVLDGKAEFKRLLQNWAVVYSANFLGALFLAALITAADMLPEDHGFFKLAEKKVAKPFVTLFVRGVLCNWLVCMAVYMSYFTHDLVSKSISIFLPISAFVSIGFEHSIANCFIIPFGMMNGANVTSVEFLLSNLLPVSLGNMLGGVIFVAVPYFVSYGSQVEQASAASAVPTFDDSTPEQKKVESFQTLTF